MISGEQRYAQAAYSSMTEGLSPNEAAVFGTICHHFPAMIRLNGLLLTAIFYEAQSSKNEDSDRSKAYKRYMKYMLQALELEVSQLSVYLKNPSCDSNCYRLLTRQALAASVWFKRYAEAILKVEAAGEPEGDAV